MAEKNPTKVKTGRSNQLRRLIYQSMQLSFQRGKMVKDPYSKTFELIPNLDILPKVIRAYEQAAEEDKRLPRSHSECASELLKGCRLFSF